MAGRPSLLRIRSRSGAFVALGVLTVVWGFTWIALKVGLSHTDAVSFTVHRSMRGLVVMFAILLLLPLEGRVAAMRCAPC